MGKKTFSERSEGSASLPAVENDEESACRLADPCDLSLDVILPT